MQKIVTFSQFLNHLNVHLSGPGMVQVFFLNTNYLFVSTYCSLSNRVIVEVKISIFPIFAFIFIYLFE